MFWLLKWVFVHYLMTRWRNMDKMKMSADINPVSGKLSCMKQMWQHLQRQHHHYHHQQQHHLFMSNKINLFGNMEKTNQENTKCFFLSILFMFLCNWLCLYIILIFYMHENEWMLTHESWCIQVVFKGALILRTLPNHFRINNEYIFI